jgi:hypothetical protein
LANLQKLFPAMGIAGDGDEDQAAKLKKILEGINRGTEVEVSAPSSLPFDGDTRRSVDPANNRWARFNDPNRKARTQPTISDPLQGGYGDAALRPGTNWSPRNEIEDARQASQDETNRILGRAGEIATAGPLNTEYQPMDTGNMIGGRNPGAANTQVYEEDALLPGQTAPTTAYGQPRTSNETSDRLNRINSGELDKELGIKKRSLASRLFRGLGRGWMNWGKEDGAFGLFDMFGEGVQSAASSKHDIEAQRQGKQRPLFRQLGQQQQQEAFNAKQATEFQQAANYGSQVSSRQLGDIRAANKDYLDRTKVTQKVSNGLYYDVDAQGKWTPHIDPVTRQQRVEGEDLLVGRTLKDGTPIWTKGSKAYSDEVAADLNQARMDFDAAKINQADLDRYEGEVTDWATKSSAWEEDKVRKPILEGQALQIEATGYDEQAAKTTDKDKKAEWQAKAVAARSKGASLIQQGNEARNKGPKKPTRPAANLTAPNLNVGQHSEATIRAGLVARGLKGKELEAKMAEARAAGVIK